MILLEDGLPGSLLIGEASVKIKSLAHEEENLLVLDYLSPVENSFFSALQHIFAGNKRSMQS